MSSQHENPPAPENDPNYGHPQPAPTPTPDTPPTPEQPAPPAPEQPAPAADEGSPARSGSIEIGLDPPPAPAPEDMGEPASVEVTTNSNGEIEQSTSGSGGADTPNGELTQDALQVKLNEYHEAFRQEFESKTEIDGSSANVVEVTRDFFKRNMSSAAAQILWLALNSTSDAVRGNMSKYIIEQGTADAKGDQNPIQDLIDQLTEKPASQRNVTTTTD